MRESSVGPYDDVDEVGPSLATDHTWANLAALNLPPICAQCTEQDGLCVRHVPDVCPRLKQPSWHREAHSGERDRRTRRRFVATADPRVLRIKRREQRKRIRAETGRVQRMVRLIQGEFAPARPAHS